MAISKLEELSIRVVASWSKLLVIMHADKIDAKKQPFLMNPQVWLESFVFLGIHRRSLYHRLSNDIPNIKDLNWYKEP